MGFSTSNGPAVLPPGARVVLVRDDVPATAWPSGVPVGGRYAGNLSNGGEEVVLLGPVGEVVDRATFAPAKEPLANGGGWSLVAQSEANMDASSWRLSARPGGSPGKADEASEPSRLDDADGDGLPDAWEARFGLAAGPGSDRGFDDRDGDGVSNLGEWLAGTDPTRPDSRLQLDALALPGGQVRLSWLRVPGKAVVVRVRDTWGGEERILQSIPGRGTGGIEELLDAPGESSRFYRLTAW
jgi:hypothetical protein